MKRLISNYKKKKIYVIFSVFLISLLFLNIVFSQSNNSLNADETSARKNAEKRFPENNDSLRVSSSEDENKIIMDELLNTKLQNYTNLGYFPQRYRLSLQAIYYALKSLEATGNLGTINISFMTDHVMRYFDSDSKLFIDDSALRYLDTDIEQGYYPLSSLLEVNCYALLSLDILNNLDQVNIQEFIDFIWSSFDYNTGGFIGQPYSSDLSTFFKVPTADNTYFAILTLDTLNIEWNDHTQEQTLIISFVDSLQIKDQYNPSFGGFLNDPSYELDTMWFFEPNIHSSYYAIKSLDILNLAEVIDLASFRDYLDMLYQDSKTYFVNAYWGGQYPWNFTNIPSTAMGLELSQIVSWTGCDTESTFNFIKNNRNNLGIWDTTTEEGTYELIDTYQVVRSLEGIGYMSQFTPQELIEMGEGIALFEQYDGYSLFSREFNSLDLIYTVSRTAKLNNRITDLEIGSIYEQVFAAFFDYSKTFHSHSHDNGPIENYHSFPIEYCTIGKRDLLGEIGVRFGHEATFKALTVLRDLYKLDDFEIHYNLSKIIEEVINSQFLEETYSNFGGFKPNSLTSDPNKANKKVFLKYSYYAIKVLEFLSDYLELGNAASLGFDVDALYVYIFNNIVETPQELYYEADYFSDTLVRLENTYYMAYILDAIDHYNLDTSKIENFVNNNLNYENIKNIYYTHKLKQLLDLNIQFNISKTQGLVRKIYDPNLHECFLDSNHTEISQELLLWLTEMSLEADMEFYYQHTKPAKLGYDFTLNVSLSNLILNSFGPYHSVK
ncbi:MAG: prenyltransferase/squalene oxidase repeat-containing protein, partial [Promethearchaeota archaeon]